ncbi:hypothetical protein WCP94_003104 [Bilophila wadsworthia]
MVEGHKKRRRNSFSSFLYAKMSGISIPRQDFRRWMRCYFEEFTSGIQQERYAVVCIELAPAVYIPSHLN